MQCSTIKYDVIMSRQQAKMAEQRLAFWYENNSALCFFIYLFSID